MKKHHAKPHSGWQMIRSRFELKSPEYHSKVVRLHWPSQSIINYSCNRMNKGAIFVLLYLFRSHPLVSTNTRFWKELYMHIQNANKVKWHSMFVKRKEVASGFCNTLYNLKFSRRLNATSLSGFQPCQVVKQRTN